MENNAPYPPQSFASVIERGINATPTDPAASGARNALRRLNTRCEAHGAKIDALISQLHEKTVSLAEKEDMMAARRRTISNQAGRIVVAERDAEAANSLLDAITASLLGRLAERLGGE